ncbi:MAG: diguanylate cyclase [Leptolyngbya sp.]|uniref:Diguanylate cyclase n=1 Tax=Shackletoniella antarctica TaxID=268115 RepID=A0A2W4VWK2_9CYAN|nr:MAG: diguanylate cyclase [Shackletoniella antarctica]PZV19738.1 MAG: diguanylate cyclase [Leptolyngbya sp.]
MPPPVVNLNLNINSIIDISHESLMRNWNRLRDWVNEETSSANTFRRLAETAELNSREKAGFLRDPELTIGLTWKQEQNPNRAWSKRYADNFEEVIIFLEASAGAYKEEVAAREQDRQREIQNTLLKQEIEERSLVEKALRASESRFRNIFENSTVGIYNTTGDGKFIAVNPSLATMLGYKTPEEMIGSITDMGLQFYLEPKRRAELTVYLKRFEKITDAESEVRHKDGHTLWISESIWSVWGEDQSFLYYEGIVQDISERRQMETELRQQRQQADRLLINILPYRVAQKLKSGVRTIAERHDQVSVLFASLVDFTKISRGMTPTKLVRVLNEIFSMFDQLVEFHRLEKIKTIGDSYMVAGGLPILQGDHGEIVFQESIAQFALDICDAIEYFPQPDGQPFKVQIGINTGPVVAGVIGRRKHAYDLWGDTVNIASQMEVTSEPERIQITPELYENLKDKFELERRENLVVIHDREPMITYWLIGRK